MGFGALRTVALELNLATHGVPATVTRPSLAAIETTAIWVTPVMDDVPAGVFSRREIRRVMVLSRADVPTVPKNTLIEAPEEEDGADVTWRVDSIELVEADHYRVLVIREPD